MNGAEILLKVQDTYLSFQNYSDIGTAVRVPAIGKGTPTAFRTYFARPDKVRFAWRSWHPHFGKSHTPSKNMIWTDGEESGMHFLGDSEHTESFSMAIAGATGVSSASVLMILPLMLPNCIDYSYKWHDMQEIQIVGNNKVAGSFCYHLRGSSLIAGDSEAWIDKDNFLVRRLRWHKKLLKKQYYTQFNYLQVATNQSLPDYLFDGSRNEAW